MNLKNPDLDLIRRIHLECGFYGFMTLFLDLEIQILIFPKRRTLFSPCAQPFGGEYRGRIETPRAGD